MSLFPMIEITNGVLILRSLTLIYLQILQMVNIAKVNKSAVTNEYNFIR